MSQTSPRSMGLAASMLGVWFALALGAAGCRPEIGDGCKISTDCSTAGDRLCDTSMPEGYCTIFACEADHCPGEASCIEFHPTSERFARRFCLRDCKQDSDCRSGYHCVPIPSQTYDAVYYDQGPKQTSAVCLP
jgi:hypothetical protein